MQHVSVSLAHGVREEPVANVAAVDEEILLVGAVARGLGRAGETAQRERSSFGFHGQACGRKFLAEDCRNAFAYSVRAVVGADASVVLKQERDVGPRKR